jgi:poly-gamma-glutamate synthesis protein (capsule biosynthesis protein)
VMSGRGIDQILPHPSSPQLHEPYMRSALGYVELAEATTGPRSSSRLFHVWGDALAVLEQERPDVRIVNLETSVTTSEDAWPGKASTIGCTRQRALPVRARLDCCTLANNHVMDWVTVASRRRLPRCVAPVSAPPAQERTRSRPRLRRSLTRRADRAC